MLSKNKSTDNMNNLLDLEDFKEYNSNFSMEDIQKAISAFDKIRNDDMYENEYINTEAEKFEDTYDSINDNAFMFDSKKNDVFNDVQENELHKENGHDDTGEFSATQSNYDRQDEPTRATNHVEVAPKKESKKIRQNKRKDGTEGSLPFDFADCTASYSEMPMDRVEKDIKIKSSLYLVRSILCFILAALSIYVTLSPTYLFYLPFDISYLAKPFLFILVLIGIQGFSMLIALDIIAAGMFRLLCFKPTSDSMVFLSCAVSLAHSFSIVIRPEWGGYIPYSCVSCLMVFFAVLSRRYKYGSLRKATKILATSNNFVGIIFDEDKDNLTNAFKAEVSKDSVSLENLRENTAADKYSCVFAPIFILTSIVFAFLSSVGTGNPERFLWAFSAMLSVSIPVCFIVSCSLPIKRTANRLYAVGSALIGLGGVKQANRCNGAVLCDEDLFPTGSVEINGVKMTDAGNRDNGIAYTSSTIEAADIGTKRLFADLSRQHSIKASDVSKLRFYESGGITAEINGNTVAVGNAGFLIRMGIHIDEGLNLKTAVFSSVNMCFSGLFALKYTTMSAVKNSLKKLIKSKIPPILATRDFNITPGMVERNFKLKRGIIDYPDIADRLELSSTDRFFPNTPVAISTRNGIHTFAWCLSSMKKLHKICKKNLVYSTLSAIVGQIVLFFLTYNGEFAAAMPANVLIYQALWAVIIYAGSFTISRY